MFSTLWYKPLIMSTWFHILYFEKTSHSLGTNNGIDKKTSCTSSGHHVDSYKLSIDQNQDFPAKSVMG